MNDYLSGRPLWNNRIRKSSFKSRKFGCCVQKCWWDLPKLIRLKTECFYVLLLVLLLLPEAVKNRSQDLGWISRSLWADMFCSIKVLYKDLGNLHFLGGSCFLVTGGVVAVVVGPRCKIWRDLPGCPTLLRWQLTAGIPPKTCKWNRDAAKKCCRNWSSTRSIVRKT